MRNIQTAERVTPCPKPSFCRQSPRAPRDDAKRAVSKILQNATESDKIRQKLVCAHAHEIPQPPTSFPRRRESLSLGMSCAQSTAHWTHPLELPSPRRHANRSSGIALASSHSAAGGR